MASRVRSVIYHDPDTNEPIDGLTVTVYVVSRDGTTPSPPFAATPRGGGAYGIEATEAQEEAGTIFIFSAPGYPYKPVTVARDELIAWILVDADGDPFPGPGSPTFLNYADKAGVAITPQPSFLVADDFLAILVVPPEHVERGVCFTVENPTGSYPETFHGQTLTSYFAAGPSGVVTYGQVFGSDGNTVPGARDLAIDFATGLFKRTDRGGLALTQGLDAIRQDIELSLQTLLGEWFLNTTIGFPMLQLVLVKSPNIPAIRNTIRSRIERRPGVLTVTKLESQYDASARKLGVQWSANTDLGELSGAATFTR